MFGGGGLSEQLIIISSSSIIKSIVPKSCIFTTCTLSDLQERSISLSHKLDHLWHSSHSLLPLVI